MPKKNGYVCAVCHASQCGNYDKLYANHCRALMGNVAASWQKCFAFMTKDEAAAIDRDIIAYAAARGDYVVRKCSRKAAYDD